MLIEVPEKVAKKIVVKRDGKKVEFDGAKIALAIQKGFGDIVGNEDPKTAKYNETDVNKVYSKVLGKSFLYFLVMCTHTYYFYSLNIF